MNTQTLVRGYSETRIVGDTVMETLYAVTPNGAVWRSDEHKFSHSFAGAWGWTRVNLNEQFLRERLGATGDGHRTDFCGNYAPPLPAMV